MDLVKRQVKGVFLLTLLPLFVACVDTDDATKGVSLTVQLTSTDDVVAASLGGQTVTLRSREGRTIELTTDALGRATLSELTPDVYNISANWSIGKEITVAGSLAEQLIKEPTVLTMEMHSHLVSKLLIGKVYMANSKDKNGVNYLNGSYMELFNQGDDTVDVAGLYIGLLESNSDQAYTLENLHEQHADSVVLLKQIFRIPTTAPHLVEPGGTVLLCNSAIDHSEFSDMEHSLLDADYEAKDVQKMVTNNPDVPALETTYLQSSSNMSNMNLTRGGPTGVVIFQTDEDPLLWPRTYKYPNTATTGAQWVLMPKRLIMDGVDILHRKNSGVDTSTKRLYDDIDAGYIALNTINGLDGEVIYRKTSDRKGANGHLLLVDTNNSGNDFQTSKTIKPREYDVPNGN